VEHPSNESNEIWRHREQDLSWREIDDEVILLDLRNAQYLQLNPTGAVLWKRLAKGATVSDLAECLQQHYSLDASRASSDAVAFVTSCVQKQLLHRVDE
jgi:hypothetical protein